MTRGRRPICFVATAQPDQAKAFYGDVLGLTLLETSPYALVYSDGGVMLRVQIVAAIAPASHTVHGWQVTDIEAEIGLLAAKGVAFQRFDQMGQDALGIWTTPDGHKIAWFNDPCGNILSLTQYAQE